jgi:ribosomal protein S18 acetylase RimI-like enzyme
VPWDSEIFGFPFFELRISDYFRGLPDCLDDFLKQIISTNRKKCLVFVRIPATEILVIKSLTDRGFYPLETMVEIRRSLKTFKPGRTFERLRLRPAAGDDKTKILAIARHAFSKDRYHLDPNLSDERAGYRYEYWLNNGLENNDHVLIYEDVSKNKSLGFCHLKDIDPTTVDFSLGAIDPAYQKTGLGVMMYNQCLSLCKKQQKNQMLTRISINNMEIVKLFSSLGFLFSRPKLVLHWYCGPLKSDK